MPSACDRVTSGDYAARHNPAVYYTNISSSCLRDDVNLTEPMRFTAAFTMIVPNICDDMHSCAVSVGDGWLKRMVPTIIESPQYQAGSLALFITFDENDSTKYQPSAHHRDCLFRVQGHEGERVVYALFASAYDRRALHLGLLGQSRSANSMVRAFHL